MTIELQSWWQSIPALPANRMTQAYYALRRVWFDHTLAGRRGMFRWGSEDNITPALFQNWAIFPNATSLSRFLRYAGASVGSLKRVQWAYACEERIDARLRVNHGRDFVIADIILVYEDEAGVGLLAIEAKKPGNWAEVKDSQKLATYCDLPSTRYLQRRSGCFLLGEGNERKSRLRMDREWPMVFWEQMARLQAEAVLDLPLSEDLKALIRKWVLRSFSRYGILMPDGEAPPPTVGGRYGSTESYRAIDQLPVPEALRRFVKGSECVEAVWRGEAPEAPMAWLAAEPSLDKIRAGRGQTTANRMVRRWDFGWTPAQECV